MTIWTFIQIAINIAFLVGLVVVWNRSTRRQKDDPRLSRGLQLLQSKISVLEDLSDRTDLQVKQLIKLIESKTRQLQTKVFESEKQIQRIDQSMHKSLEVASIFQDKIPHEEIIERQNSVKYIQAAQLAHQGRSVDEIVGLVGLSKGEVEFIAKVNKDQLMFDEESLPEWAKQQVTNEQSTVDSVEALIEQNYEKAFEPPKADLASLEKLGEEFRTACKQHDEEIRREEEQIIDFTPQLQKAKQWSKDVAHHAGDITSQIASQTGELTKVALEKGAEATKIAATRGAELTKKVTQPAAEALQEATQKLTEKATQSFDKMMPEINDDPGQIDTGTIQQMSFTVDMDEDKIESPMASHQNQMLDAIIEEVNSQPKASADFAEDTSLSLSDMLDQPKSESSEVRKVVFPNIEDPQV